MRDNDFVKAAAVAQKTIIERVYNPKFFETLSALYGPPKNVEEATAVLKLASRLLQEAKKAGFPSEPEYPGSEAIKAAAAMLQKDETVKKAAIVLNQGGVTR